jgi:hypothetical protein
MADRSGAGACVVRLEKRVSLSLGVHATLFQAQVFAILSSDKECIGGTYTGGQICIC